LASEKTTTSTSAAYSTSSLSALPTPTAAQMSSPTPSSTPSASLHLSKGASAGIGVGIALGVIAVIAALLWYFSFRDQPSEDMELPPVGPNGSVYHQTDRMSERSQPLTRDSRPMTSQSVFANTLDSSSSPKSSSGHVHDALSPAQQATRAMLESIRNDDRHNFI
jgi:hypothetical protein